MIAPLSALAGLAVSIDASSGLDPTVDPILSSLAAVLGHVSAETSPILFLGEAVPVVGADPVTFVLGLFVAGLFAGLFLRHFLDGPAHSGGPEDDPFLDQ